MVADGNLINNPPKSSAPLQRRLHSLSDIHYNLQVTEVLVDRYVPAWAYPGATGLPETVIIPGKRMIVYPRHETATYPDGWFQIEYMEGAYWANLGAGKGASD